MPEILVRGHAEADLPPTDAAITVTVYARVAGSQTDAVAQCAQRCEAVDALVDAQRGGLVRRAVTSSMRTGPEWDHSAKGGRRLVGHVATRSTQMDCAPDGEALTQLLQAIGGMADVQVHGPKWRVAPDAPGWDEVRAAAAADARARAESYAAGLHLAVGRVIWLSEPGLRRDGDGGGGASMAFTAAAPMTRAMKGGVGMEDEEQAVVRIQPEPLTVTVDVEAAFDLT